MTEQELAKVMRLLEMHYRNFYQGANKEEVFAAWYPFFKGDDPRAVETAVVEVICSSTFPPVVADIKRQMGEDEEEGKPTALEAFQMIAEAVDESNNRQNAAEAFNALPPILRKVVRDPSWLIRWHSTDENAFNTVIMSAIRESYKELAKRETKYHTLPEGIRRTSAWRVDGTDAVALPEAKERKTVDEILDEMDVAAKEFRNRNGLTANETLNDKVRAFITPMTEQEKKAFEAREKHALEKRLERMES